jgi:hypothetical protein
MAYLYRHIRHDKNEPFYIGIGSDSNYKRSKQKNARNNIWKGIVSRTTYDIEILFSDISTEYAKQKEIEFIALYGRIANKDGILANLSGGGECNENPSLLTREKLSIATKGVNNPFYGKKHTKETREFLSKRQIGLKRGPLPESTKIKIGDANRGGSSWVKGLKQPIAGKKRTGVNHFKYKGKIDCYDLEMNLIGTFDCARDIVNEFGIKHINDIRRVLVGERSYHNGMIFKYSNN